MSSLGQGEWSERGSSSDSDEERLVEEDEMNLTDLGTIKMEAERRTFEMTPNHSKLLILISKYGIPASAQNAKESWIRELPLTVMIYEGVTAGVIDCDYAPKSMIISSDGASPSKHAQMDKACVNML